MKKIDVSVLPDGFLLQINHVTNNILYGWSEKIKTGGLSNDQLIYRPALNYRHFNDGKMVLPDGLVIEAYHLDGFEYKTCTPYRLEHDVEDPLDSAIAIEILGVTAEYGAQLGMEVIEL